MGIPKFSEESEEPGNDRTPNSGVQLSCHVVGWRFTASPASLLLTMRYNRLKDSSKDS